MSNNSDCETKHAHILTHTQEYGGVSFSFKETPKELIIQTKNTPKFTEYFEIFHNNGIWHEIYGNELIDSAISKLRTGKYKPNKIITNHNTLMRIQKNVERIISSIKIEDKERTEQLLIATFMAVSVKDGILTRYRGLDIEIRDVPVDGIDRIYVCDGDKAGIEIRDLK